MTLVSHMADEPPLAGGVFRRCSELVGRWGGLSVPVIEEIYGPSRHQARIQVEEQRRVVQPSASPTDPGRSGRRFTGTVVLRRGDPAGG